MAFNRELSILASAARTATTTSDAVRLHHAVAMHVIINVTAVASTPSVVPTIQGFDSTSGVYYDLLVGNAITATGTTVLKIGLGMAASANASAQDLIPHTIRVKMTHADSDSITYSVGCNVTEPGD